MQASKAWAISIEKVGLLTAIELDAIIKGLETVFEPEKNPKKILSLSTFFLLA
jgi:hypothetical protein